MAFVVFFSCWIVVKLYMILMSWFLLCLFFVAHLLISSCIVGSYCCLLNSQSFGSLHIGCAWLFWTLAERSTETALFRSNILVDGDLVAVEFGKQNPCLSQNKHLSFRQSSVKHIRDLTCNLGLNITMVNNSHCGSGKKNQRVLGIFHDFLFCLLLLFFWYKKGAKSFSVVGGVVQHDPTVFLLGCQTGPFLVRHKRKIIPPPFWHRHPPVAPRILMILF